MGSDVRFSEVASKAASDVASKAAQSARSLMDEGRAAATEGLHWVNEHTRATPMRSLGIAAAVLLTLELARQHPLLDRVVRTEPERLVPLLTTDEGLVLPLARAPVEAVIGERFPGLGDVVRRRTADVLVRLLISFALNAPDDPPEVVADVVAGLLVDGVRAAEGAA